jgi:hypothetical protein
MKYLPLPLFWFFLGVLALYLLEVFAEWEPLNSHAAYMDTEYPDLMTFRLAELKIDKFLIDLENK